MNTAVISENGGLFIQRDVEHGVKRQFWHADAKRQVISDQLAKIGRHISQMVPSAIIADDQPFRLTSLAWRSLNQILRQTAASSRRRCAKRGSN
jgi:hypothetical protein